MSMMRFKSTDDPAYKELLAKTKTKAGPIVLKKISGFVGGKKNGFAKGRMKAGQMNETEKAYAAYLESERIAGRIKAYWFESIKLKIAEDTCWYNPDFLVLTAEDQLELHEVKGSPKFFAEDAKVKTKVCATEYPFRMLVVYPERGKGWTYQEF